MRFIIFVLVIYSTSLFSKDPSNYKNLFEEPPLRVLFVGNSYFYYNDSLHNHVRRMVEETFPDKKESLEFKSATIGGSRLSHHNIDHLLSYKNLSVSQPFQVVILQGGSGEVLDAKSRRQFKIQSKRLINKIKKTGAIPVLYMIHAYVEPHENYDPNMINQIIDVYEKSGSENNTLVFPVGIAFKNAYSLKPSIQLHKDFDGTHPDILGTYLSACVVFATLYKKDPTRLDYDYYGEIDSSDAKLLQDVAKETVEKYFDITL